MTQDMFEENWNGQPSVRRSQIEMEFCGHIQGLSPSIQIDAMPTVPLSHLVCCKPELVSERRIN